VREFLAATEELIAERLATAVESSELPSDYLPREGARRAVNEMLSLGARARMGTPREELLSDAAEATAIALRAKPQG
jgi:hypothetical protein